MKWLFSRRRGAGLLVSLAVLGGLRGSAAAQDLRYSTTQPGNVIATGNTLGLAKQLGLNGPGVEDSIGTFTSLDSASVDLFPDNPLNPWFAGTTSDWHMNGSDAFLDLPAEAEVLYAELVWGGSFQYGDENVLADLDSTVTLGFGADTLTVSPNAATAVTVNIAGSFPIRYYMRSAEVTNFVQTHLDGFYSVSGVPGTQSALSNTTNAAGWTLILAYRYDGEPIRNMSVFVGGLFVDENTTVDYPVDGFCAPPSAPIEGTIAIATIEGDADRVGDQLAIGETVGDPTFVNLSGPNNPVDNFFCSQLNDPSGNLDTNGTFGDLNHAPGSNVSGGRQGWDVTHVALSSDDGHLVPDQTSAVLRTQTLDDSYMPVLAGIAIDVNAPKFLYDQSTTMVDKDTVALGEEFTLTVKLVNEGSAPANGVAFNLALPSGIDLSSFSTNGQPGDISGGTVVLGDLASGVDMGDIAPNDERTVVATFEVAAAQPNDILLQPIWTYDYQVCINDPATPEQFKATAVTIDFDGGTGGAGGAGGGSDGGAGGAGGGNGGAGNSDDGGNAFPEGGGFIRCSSDGSAPGGGAWMLIGLIGLAGLARRRSERR